MLTIVPYINENPEREYQVEKKEKEKYKNKQNRKIQFGYVYWFRKSSNKYAHIFSHIIVIPISTFEHKKSFFFRSFCGYKTICFMLQCV